MSVVHTRGTRRRERGSAWPGRILFVVLLMALVPLMAKWLGLWPFASTRPQAQDLLFNQPAAGGHTGPVVVSADEQINQDVFARVHKAVVNIVATTLRMNFWMEVIPQAGQGSGFVVDPKGYIMTNNHVVEKAQQLTVTTAMGKKVEAQLVGRDSESDLAVIKIPPEDVEAVAVLGDADTLHVGQKAIAIGNPFGLAHTMTTGVISALNREISTGPNAKIGNLIQTDAAINPGNSGGPLLNSNGEVIGINTAIFSVSGGYQGIGFAIPINHAREVATQLISMGRVARPWLGITGITLSRDLAAALQLNVERGVLLVQVVRGGPAYQAGLRGGDREVIIGHLRLPIGGDVIISIDGKPVSSMEELGRILKPMRVDDTITVEVVRDGRRQEISVRLKERPVP